MRDDSVRPYSVELAPQRALGERLALPVSQTTAVGFCSHVLIRCGTMEGAWRNKSAEDAGSTES